MAAVLHHHRLPRARCERVPYLVEKARGKRVLHLGCADSPYTADRLRDGDLLHLQLAAVAREIVGVDLDAAALDLVARHAPGSQLVVADVEDLPHMSGRFDVIIAGEIIEHLNNPGRFLESCARLMDDATELVITTVNAYRVTGLLRIPFGVESVHPDHVYYFSHRTLEVLCRRHGFEPTERYGYRIVTRRYPLPSAVEAVSSWISPNLTNGIVHTYRLARKHDG